MTPQNIPAEEYAPEIHPGLPPIQTSYECVETTWPETFGTHEMIECLGWQPFGLDSSGKYLIGLREEGSPGFSAWEHEIKDAFDSKFKMLQSTRDEILIDLWGRDDYLHKVRDIAEAVHRRWGAYSQGGSVFIDGQVRNTHWVATHGGREDLRQFVTGRIPTDADIVDLLPADATAEEWELTRAAAAMAGDVWTEVLYFEEMKRRKEIQPRQKSLFESFPGLSGLGEEMQPFALPPGEDWERGDTYKRFVRAIAKSLNVQLGASPLDPEHAAARRVDRTELATALSVVDPEDQRALDWIRRNADYEPLEIEIDQKIEEGSLPSSDREYVRTVLKMSGDIANLVRQYAANRVEAIDTPFVSFYDLPQDPVNLHEEWDEPGSRPGRP